MASKLPLLQRLCALLLVPGLTAALMIAAVSPAAANGPGGPFSVDMTTVSELPERDGWGVVNVDPNAIHAMDNLVWDFAQIGNQMFVGGSFLDVQDPTTGATFSQPYLAAFDIDTGAWDPSFAPALNGPVRALEVSPDGFLLVGGEFTSLNGLANTSGLTGIDPTDGSKASGFHGSVTRPWYPAEPAIVRTLEVIGNDVYVGGSFNFLRGANNQLLQVDNLGRTDARFGTPDSSWQPDMSGGIWGFGIDTSRNRIHFSGWSIPELNGQPAENFGTIDLTTAATVTGQASVGPRFKFDVEYAADSVWIAGVTNNRVSKHDGADLTFELDHSSDGDYQVVEAVGDWIIAGCHCIGTSPYLAHVINANTGAELSWTPDLDQSNEGTWAVHSDTNGCLWLGGDYGLAGNNAGSSFWVGSFARFCSPGGVPATNPNCTATTMTNGSILVAWDNLAVNGYDVGETGAAPVWESDFSWVDSTAGTSYTVTAWGTGQTSTCIVDAHLGGGGGGWNCAVTDNGNGSVTITWGNIGATGYDLSQDGATPIWITTTSYTDFTPGTNYNLTAWGGGVGGVSTSCTNPNPGGGGWTCTVTDNGNGSVTIAWGGIGASGYDLSQDGANPIWITTTSYIDFTPGTTYTLTSWGNGVNGNTASCTNPNPGGGGWTCSVADNGNGSVTVTWADIGANGYDLSHDGGAATWVTSTSYVDTTPGTTYTVVAWGNGVNGTTTTCTL